MKTKQGLEFKVLSPFTVKREADVVNTTDQRVLRISGYANWSGKDGEGKTYTDLDGDVVVPGGVDTTVWAVNPQILLQHDRDVTIGRGLSLEVRDDGLYLEAEIHADALDPKDWYRIKTGLLGMFSIGFRALDGEWKELDGRVVFFITRSLLLEVSIVSIPCNSHSSFSVIKSLAGGRGFGGSDSAVEGNTKHVGEPMKTVKVKYQDYLSAEAVEDLRTKGVDVDADVEMSFVTLIKHIAGQVAAEVVKGAVDDLQAKAEEAAKAAGGEVPIEGGEVPAEGGEVPVEGGESDNEAAKALADLLAEVAKLKVKVVGDDSVQA